MKFERGLFGLRYSNSYTHHLFLFYLPQRFAFRFVLHMRSPAVLVPTWAMAIVVASSPPRPPASPYPTTGTVRATLSNLSAQAVMAARVRPAFAEAEAEAGAYVKTANVSLTIGNNISFQVGLGGGAGATGSTTFNGSAIVAAPGWNASGATRGLGGAVASSTGTIVNPGGNGRTATTAQTCG